jgi:hypothetical protein
MLVNLWANWDNAYVAPDPVATEEQRVEQAVRETPAGDSPLGVSTAGRDFADTLSTIADVLLRVLIVGLVVATLHCGIGILGLGLPEMALLVLLGLYVAANAGAIGAIVFP